jgi:GNAT superfamily N-acetyltransferase
MKGGAPDLPGPSSFRYNPPVPEITVTRTFLEMLSPDELRPAAEPVELPRIDRVEECPPSFFRYHYAEVGRAYHWTDRLAWSEEKVRGHLADPGVSLWVLNWRGAPAGYFELSHRDRAVEIAYFGLLPEFVGRGWGKFLLTEAVRTAWSLDPEKVWLHTCTLDHPAALPNYVGRGFRPVRQETYSVVKPSAG